MVERCEPVTDPDRVRDRWLALQEPGVITALRGRCEAAAVEVRLVPFSWRTYHPRPLPPEMAGEDPPRGSIQDARLGIDATGRVVFQHLRDDLFQLYEWTGTHCDL